MKNIRNFFKKFKSKLPKPIKIHDLSNRYYGHDYTILKIKNEGFEISISGWYSGMKKGEHLLLQSNTNSSGNTLYKINKIKYCKDPRDRFFAELQWIPTRSCKMCKTLYYKKEGLKECPLCRIKL